MTLLNRTPEMDDEQPFRRRYLDKASRRWTVIGIFVVLTSLFLGSTSFYFDQTQTLRKERSALRVQVSDLQKALDSANARSVDLSKQLDTKTTQLSQLTGDAQGKDAVIKGLQDDATTKQAQIDSLNSQVASLKGCLDGVTLALVQLTNAGNSAAQNTINGVRDVCRQAQVLL